MSTTRQAPTPVRAAAVVVALQGAAAVVVALALVVRRLAGSPEQPWLSAYGTALWFLVMGAGVLVAGGALLTGRRWGRGIAVFVQLLLLPVAWYMAVGSQRWLLGVPIAAVAIAVLGLLFSPPALRWLTDQPAGGPPDDPARSASSAPETR